MKPTKMLFYSKSFILLTPLLFYIIFMCFVFLKPLFLCSCMKIPSMKVFLELQNPANGDNEDFERDDGGDISIMQLIAVALWKENIY